MMMLSPPSDRWEVVTRNDAAVQRALARGACDGLLPGALFLNFGVPDRSRRHDEAE